MSELPGTEPLPEKKPVKKLSPAEWEQVVVLWELGKSTLAELSNLFGISKVALNKGLKNRGSVKGIRSHEIGTSALEAAKSDVQKNLERVASMKERYLGYSDLLAKLTMREITEAVRDKIPLANKRNDIQTLQRAASVMATLRNENFHLFGLYDEDTIKDELPEIGITEYSADEISKIQRGFEEVEDIIDTLDDDTDLKLPFGDEEETS
jgi:hypothetical protein